jgi:hypothetical protein
MILRPAGAAAAEYPVGQAVGDPIVNTDYAHTWMSFSPRDAATWRQLIASDRNFMKPNRTPRRDWKHVSMMRVYMFLAVAVVVLVIVAMCQFQDKNRC